MRKALPNSTTVAHNVPVSHVTLVLPHYGGTDMLTMAKASVAASLVVIVAACSDHSMTAPTTRLNPSNSLTADRSVETRQQEVTGHAYYLVTPEQNEFEEYSVSAIRHKD